MARGEVAEKGEDRGVARPRGGTERDGPSDRVNVAGARSMASAFVVVVVVQLVEAQIGEPVGVKLF